MSQLLYEAASVQNAVVYLQNEIHDVVLTKWGFLQVFNKRYDLWPGLQSHSWLDRFAKACRNFPYHFAIGKYPKGVSGYDPSELGDTGPVVLPTGSLHDNPSDDPRAPASSGNVVTSTGSDKPWLSQGKSERFMRDIIDINKLKRIDIEFGALESLAPLRPLSFLAVMIGYHYPNIMVQFTVQALSAVASDSKSPVDIQNFKEFLGLGRSKTAPPQLNGSLVLKFVNETNTLIESMFPGKASESVLGGNKDKIAKEWMETTKMTKLFIMMMSPQVR